MRKFGTYGLNFTPMIIQIRVATTKDIGNIDEYVPLKEGKRQICSIITIKTISVFLKTNKQVKYDYKASCETSNIMNIIRVIRTPRSKR